MNSKLKSILRPFVPPILVKLAKLDFFNKPLFVYAPHGWNTPIKQSDNSGWNSTHAVEIEKKRWADYINALKGTGPIGFMHEHDDPTEIKDGYHHRNITFAYVLTLVAMQKETISILDYGGSLGHNYYLAKVFLPAHIKIDFHCKEVPMVVELGKELSPHIHWYDDDSCLNKNYDLVIANGLLNYMTDWKELLIKLVDSVGDYLFLGHLPLVNNVNSFVTLQWRYNTEMLHNQLNRNEVLSAVKLPLIREFLTGVHPYMNNVPEQCELISFLFRNKKKSN